MALSVFHITKLALAKRRNLIALVDEFETQLSDPENLEYKLQKLPPRTGRRRPSITAPKRGDATCKCHGVPVRSTDRESSKFLRLSTKFSSKLEDEDQEQQSEESIASLWNGIHSAVDFLHDFLNELYEEWSKDIPAFLQKYRDHNQFGVVSLLLIRQEPAFRVLVFYLLFYLVFRPEACEREVVLGLLDGPSSTVECFERLGLVDLVLLAPLVRLYFREHYRELEREGIFVAPPAAAPGAAPTAARLRYDMVVRMADQGGFAAPRPPHAGSAAEHHYSGLSRRLSEITEQRKIARRDRARTKRRRRSQRKKSAASLAPGHDGYNSNAESGHGGINAEAERSNAEAAEGGEKGKRLMAGKKADLPPPPPRRGARRASDLRRAPAEQPPTNDDDDDSRHSPDAEAALEAFHSQRRPAKKSAAEATSPPERGPTKSATEVLEAYVGSQALSDDLAALGNFVLDREFFLEACQEHNVYSAAMVSLRAIRERRRMRRIDAALRRRLDLKMLEKIRRASAAERQETPSAWRQKEMMRHHSQEMMETVRSPRMEARDVVAKQKNFIEKVRRLSFTPSVSSGVSSAGDEEKFQNELDFSQGSGVRIANQRTLDDSATGSMPKFKREDTMMLKSYGGGKDSNLVRGLEDVPCLGPALVRACRSVPLAWRFFSRGVGAWAAMEKATLCFLLQVALYMAVIQLDVGETRFEEDIREEYRISLSMLSFIFTFLYGLKSSVQEFFVNSCALYDSSSLAEKFLLAQHMAVNIILPITMPYLSALLLREAGGLSDIILNSFAVYFMIDLDDDLVTTEEATLLTEDLVFAYLNLMYTKGCEKAPRLRSNPLKAEQYCVVAVTLLSVLSFGASVFSFLHGPLLNNVESFFDPDGDASPSSPPPPPPADS